MSACTQHSLFKRVFPGGDSEMFCDHIYRIFDSDGNGYLDFKVTKDAILSDRKNQLTCYLN